MASCSASDLLSSAQCFACLSKRQLQAIIVQLLCNISVDGTGTTNFVGSGSPEGVVTADPAAMYFDQDTDQFYYKKTGSGNTGWQQLG